jgi:hypothetical protein
MNAKYVRSGARLRLPALLTGPYATRKLKTMCEDYPCCGHGTDGCRGEGASSNDYLVKLSRPDYDEYYDQEGG